MPELPEVETVVRDLRPLVVGQRVAAVRVGRKRLRRPWRRAWTARACGAVIGGIRRRGKWIILDLDTGARLVVHLGMTGQFTATPKTVPTPDHTHLVFTMEGEVGELRFRDVRRFGSVEWLADEADVQKFLLGKLGPEPDRLDPAAFEEAVRKTKRPLKAILLDQRVVAGVGNIYADEALHQARLHPERRGITLARVELNRLREAIAAVIARAIEHRGSTIRDYIGGSGLRGGFQDRHAVYGRTGKPCPTCAAPIAVARVAGRSSHYCPRCQKRGRSRT
jgi:formamidopyrimidine-DNA glycosylase